METEVSSLNRMKEDLGGRILRELDREPMVLGQQRITDNLDQLVAILPDDIRSRLQEQQHLEELLEVVIDLGRPPEARFPASYVFLCKRHVTRDDIDYVTGRVGEFGGDNRAGIERTLHRISAIRNRHGKVVGLTCRVGRAVYGTIDIIRDVIETGKSILLVGAPGVGKTTKLREVARILSTEFEKRVVIVDTSNEIGGDGDIPHPSIGHARRMQVQTPELQHQVMIEAVENHMPEVVVIDEIGVEEEAYAARTIAERGVQLVATAHGNSLENLVSNPTLCDLVGGIQAVTLSDEEAKRRGTQKTVLERKAPPTFDIVIEILEIDKLAIHMNVARTVDRMLRGYPPRPEIRVRSAEGRVEIVAESDEEISELGGMAQAEKKRGLPQTIRVFPYGVSRSRLERAIRELKVPVFVARSTQEADVIVALKAHYRREFSGKLKEAMEDANIPTFVVKSNTYTQILACLREVLDIDPERAEELAIKEVEEAIERFHQINEPIELLPQNSYIRRIQHQIIEKHGLRSESLGVEPFRRIRISKG
jgi:stage III sporulation protein SpoIIIAA